MVLLLLQREECDTLFWYTYGSSPTYEGGLILSLLLLPPQCSFLVIFSVSAIAMALKGHIFHSHKLNKTF
jgi:hypothetical protein